MPLFFKKNCIVERGLDQALNVWRQGLNPIWQEAKKVKQAFGQVLGVGQVNLD